MTTVGKRAKSGDANLELLVKNTIFASIFKIRDYLLPIQSRMLSLTDGLWKQNPGWNN